MEDKYLDLQDKTIPKVYKFLTKFLQFVSKLIDQSFLILEKFILIANGGVEPSNPTMKESAKEEQ